MNKLILIPLIALPASAQLFSVGVKGGIPLTDAFDTAVNQDIRYTTNTRRYLVGPAVELRFPIFGIEFNALYKRLNYDSTNQTATDVVFSSTAANSWEFPVLLKVRAPAPLFRPYFSVGPNFRHLSDIKQTATSVVNGDLGTLRPSELNNRFSAGFAVGAGVEFGRRFRIVPEVRYTRWGNRGFERDALLGSNQNQLDFLVGIHF